jgi:hypothetical protein
MLAILTLLRPGEVSKNEITMNAHLIRVRRKSRKVDSDRPGRRAMLRRVAS